MIAAGEVIERPASVVKELVENALDAGARSIQVELRGSGLDMIRVSDDGIGIPADEIALACTRHATSKLEGFDLSGVTSLGFRGEALPSIAAVAELTIVSATDNSGVGRRVTLRTGGVEVDEPAPRPVGTTMSVRNLFHNVPARLASAGRPQTEMAQVAQVVRRLALVAPSVQLSLRSDRREVVRTRGSGDLTSTLIDLYGAELAGHLLTFGPKNLDDAVVRGIIGSPELTVPGRGHIHVIVAGRWAQPRGLLAMIESAYRPLLPRGRHPILVVIVETDSSLIDVNLHPAKLEVRLLHERAIGEAAAGLIRDVLGRTPIPLRLERPTSLIGLDLGPRIDEAPASYDADDPIVTPHLPPLRLIGQVANRLLLLEAGDGMYLIDQHRAHERILYERMTQADAGGGPKRVTLPEPLLIELTAAQARRFSRRQDELAALGFEWEEFGGRAFLLRTAPSMPGVLASETPGALASLGESGELVPTLRDLTSLEDEATDTWSERLLVRLACRTALRRGRPLSREAMRALVEGVGQSDLPAVCPHGSPLLMHVSVDQLERQFDWR